MERILYTTGTASLGKVLVAQSAQGICAVLIGDDGAALVGDLQERFPQAEIESGTAQKILADVIAQIEDPSCVISHPLDPRGTNFQRRVWRELGKIPSGATASYAEVASRLKAPRAFRAVATACAANPIAVLIPCHRVLRGDGGLSGYRWGVERKRILLEREKKSVR